MIKKTNVMLALLIFSLCAPTVNAKKEQNTASSCERREPTINYEKAVKIAKNELKKYMRIEESFIDLISLDCQNSKNTWSVGFRKKAYESGHFIIKVRPDSTVQLSITKDG